MSNRGDHWNPIWKWNLIKIDWVLNSLEGIVLWGFFKCDEVFCRIRLWTVLPVWKPLNILHFFRKSNYVRRKVRWVDYCIKGDASINTWNKAEECKISLSEISIKGKIGYNLKSDKIVVIDEWEWNIILCWRNNEVAFLNNWRYIDDLSSICLVDPVSILNDRYVIWHIVTLENLSQNLKRVWWAVLHLNACDNVRIW